MPPSRVTNRSMHGPSASACPLVSSCRKIAEAGCDASGGKKLLAATALAGGGGGRLPVVKTSCALERSMIHNQMKRYGERGRAGAWKERPSAKAGPSGSCDTTAHTPHSDSYKARWETIRLHPIIPPSRLSKQPAALNSEHSPTHTTVNQMSVSIRVPSTAAVAPSRSRCAAVCRSSALSASITADDMAATEGAAVARSMAAWRRANEMLRFVT